MNAQIHSISTSPSNHFLADAATPTPKPQAVQRVQWNFSVNPRDVFTLCRALVACEYVDILRCTPVVKRHESQIRVDITLPVDQINTILSCVMTAVDHAGIGRTQLLGIH